MNNQIPQTQQPAGDSAGFLKIGVRFGNGASLKNLMNSGGILKMMMMFCLMLCVSGGVRAQTTVSLSVIKRFAEEGNINNQYILGQIYNYGSKEAEKLLGGKYKFDFDADKNIDQAIYWYKKAADDGHADSALNAQARLKLGLIYQEKGDDGDKNSYKESIYWFEKYLKNQVGVTDIGINLAIASIDSLKAKVYPSSRANINSSSSKSAATRTDLTAGQQVEIIDSGKVYSSINKTDALTWPNNEIKTKACKEEWGKFDFVPKAGMKGKIISVTKHSSSGKTVYVLLIDNKYYVPIGADGVK